MNLFVIMPVHNRIHYTQACLHALSQQTMRAFHIVVVDDGSSDGTRDMIAREFPEVVVLHGDGELWWTRSVNLGVRYALEAGADYLVTLNNDTVAPPDFMANLVQPLMATPLALLGCVERNMETHELVYGGRRMDWMRARRVNVLHLLKDEERRGLHAVDHLPGRGLLIPAQVFAAVGFFDETHFPQTQADFDFTYRAYRAGYALFCNYEAQLEVYSDSKTSQTAREDKNLANYYHYLFGKKGGGNLPRFVWFAWKNCPTYFLPSYLALGLARRILGYLLEWLNEGLRGKTVAVSGP